jgi:hypothetical protein
MHETVSMPLLQLHEILDQPFGIVAAFLGDLTTGLTHAD